MNEKTVGELWRQARLNSIKREYEKEKRWKRIQDIVEKVAMTIFALIAVWCVAKQVELIGAIVGGLV